MQRLCVFCGSALGNGGISTGYAVDWGRHWPAAASVWCSGPATSLDGGPADAVLEAGGKAVGVIPQSLVDRELAHTGLTR